MKQDDPFKLLQKYRNKTLIVDTNILLVFFIGKWKVGKIESFDRTSGYEQEDFHKITTIIKSFSSILTTPNIVTEIHNLVSKLNQDEKEDFLAKTLALIKELKETFYPSMSLVDHGNYLKLGLTDCSIIELASLGNLVLTDDLDLHVALQKMALPSLKYSHIKYYAL